MTRGDDTIEDKIKHIDETHGIYTMIVTIDCLVIGVRWKGHPSWYFQEEDKRKSIRARWKGAGMGDYECTNCWEVVSGGDKYNFCPWCGAYMKA